MFDMKGPNANKLGYKKTKIGVIPDTWDIKTCSDVAAEQRNAMVGGPFGSDLVSADYVNEGVPVIRGQNMGGRFLSGSYVYVTEKKAESLKANLARPGDIVFTQRGTLGQVSLVPEMPFSSYLISQSQMKLTVNRAIADVLFLFYVFSSENQQAFIRVETIQTGVPHINLGILRRVPVQIPPLPEQKKIAQVLSTCDAAIEQLSRLISAKKSQKNALMQQLLSGKKRLPGFSGEWKTRRLGELFTERNEVDAAHLPLLAITGARGVIHSSEVNRRDSSSEDKSRYKVIRPGDIGYNTMRMWQGVSAVSQLHGIISPAYTVCIPGPDVDASFIRHLFKFQPTVHLFWRYSQGLVDDTLSLKYPSFASIVVAVPSLGEQRAIADVLACAEAEISLLERKCGALQQLKKGLMQKLLTGQIRVKP